MERVFIVMGVSASGKTTIGKSLAERTGGEFFDGDDFHPKANVDKMASGQPLNDEDRQGWLEELANLAYTQAQKDKPTFIACSALKEKYRRILETPFQGGSSLEFLFLHASPEVIRERIKQRYEKEGHFMPPSMLDSQLDVLELPENAYRLEVTKSPDELVEQVFTKFFTK